jgi:hypothetical protein
MNTVHTHQLSATQLPLSPPPGGPVTTVTPAGPVMGTDTNKLGALREHAARAPALPSAPQHCWHAAAQQRAFHALSEKFPLVLTGLTSALKACKPPPSDLRSTSGWPRVAADSCGMDDSTQRRPQASRDLLRVGQEPRA